jgi:hypothetical protein
VRRGSVHSTGDGIRAVPALAAPRPLRGDAVTEANRGLGASPPPRCLASPCLDVQAHSIATRAGGEAASTVARERASTPPEHRAAPSCENGTVGAGTMPPGRVRMPPPNPRAERLALASVFRAHLRERYGGDFRLVGPGEGPQRDETPATRELARGLPAAKH